MKKYFIMSAFIFLYLAVYFIISNYVGSAFAIVFLIKELINNPDSLAQNPEAFMNTYIQSSVWYMIIAALISFPIYMFIMWLRKKSIFKYCEFSRVSFKNTAAIALLGISLNFVVEFLIALTSLDKLSPSVQEMFKTIFEGNSFATILIGIGLIGPFIEEVIFRGLVFNELRKNIPVPAALIIQAFLFGAYHLNLTQGIYAFLLGIVLGLVYLWMKSIWAPVILHVFFNSTSSVLSKLVDQQVINNYQYFILAASVIALAATLIFIWKSRKRAEPELIENI